jgi:hypothetical protein
MRIFLSCQQALKPHPVPAYSFWEYYLKNALVEAGHEIVEAPEVDWAEGLMPLSREKRAEWLGRTWTRTLDFIRTEHRRKPINLFLGYLFPVQIEPSAVCALREGGIPSVNFFCDNIREFTKIPNTFKAFDLHWVPEADARSIYKSAGLPFIYLPMPMWVQPRHRTVPATENEKVIFVGSHDMLREELLGEAVKKGLDIEIYGSGWIGGPQNAGTPNRSLARKLANQMEFLGKEGIWGVAMRATYSFRGKPQRGWIEQHAHSPIADEAYFGATRDARVVIGVNRCPSFRRSFSNPLRYSRLRDIEAPMLGACYLTEMAPGIDDLYELGTEIEIYRNAAELVEKASSLRGDPQRRLQLRQRGQRRALSEHTIGKSIERIMLKLDLSP